MVFLKQISKESQTSFLCDSVAQEILGSNEYASQVNLGFGMAEN